VEREWMRTRQFDMTRAVSGIGEKTPDAHADLKAAGLTYSKILDEHNSVGE